MAESKSNSRGIWITVLVLLTAAALLGFVLPANRDKITVRAARADRQTLINTVATNGRVEPIVDFQAHAPVASVIDAMPVHLGQQVERGQELVRLNASDAQSRISAAEATLSGAQGTLTNMQAGGTQDELLGERADLAAAETQAHDAAHALDALHALQAKGAASANEVAAAQQRLNDAQAKVTQVQGRLRGRYSARDLAVQRAQVDQAHAALSAAQSSISGMDVHSPISGTVYSLPYARYDFVNAGDALVNVADLNRLQVRAYFDEPDIGKLVNGQAVEIRWPAKPNLIFHGFVTQVPTSVITYNGTRNVGVCLISIDDANGALIPNINVNLRVTTSEHPNIISVPREALHTDGGRNYVFRIVDNKLVRTPVTVHEGDVTLTRVGISEGLHQGDLVALSATTDVELHDGLHVKAQT